jgi:hypothetical protein
MSINGRGKDILMDTKGNIVEVEEQSRYGHAAAVGSGRADQGCGNRHD